MDNWQRDQEGTILGAGLHDAKLFGVTVEDSNVTFRYETWDHKSNAIILHGVTELSVGNFWLGNIVGQAWLWETGAVEPSLWRRLFAGRIVEFPSEDNLDRLIASAKGKLFFALECSYGAQIYALCDSIEIV